MSTPIQGSTIGSKKTPSKSRTLGIHLKQAAKTLNVDDKQLLASSLEQQGYSADECPPDMRWFFLAFLELARSRPMGPGGPLALDWSQLESWMRLMDLDLTPWEVQVLVAIDDVWVRVFYGRKRTPSTSG